MLRLTRAPDIALATLWCDLLCQAGLPARVQRLHLAGAAGELPPAECLPEIWLLDDRDLAPAQTLLKALTHLPQRRWYCRGCGELVEGAFEQCWNCGAAMPG